MGAVKNIQIFSNFLRYTGSAWLVVLILRMSGFTRTNGSSAHLQSNRAVIASIRSGFLRADFEKTMRRGKFSR